LNFDNYSAAAAVAVVVVAVDNSLEEAAHNLRWAGNIVELVAAAVDCTIVVAAAGYMMDAAAVTDTTAAADAAAVDFVGRNLAWLVVVVADIVVVVADVAVVAHAQSVQSLHWRTRLEALGSKTCLPTIFLQARTQFV